MFYSNPSADIVCPAMDPWRFDEDLKAEIPMTHLWTLVHEEEIG